MRAHSEPDKVRRAYNRAQYWAERVRMMQWWADYLDSCKWRKPMLETGPAELTEMGP